MNVIYMLMNVNECEWMMDVDVDIYHGMVVHIPYTIEHINIQDPYHTISYHIVPFHTISYHIIPYHTISYHIIPYHITSHICGM